MRREEGVRAIILYFLVVIVGKSSETSHSASNSTANGLTMLYRSEIDDDGAERPPLCHFSPISGRITVIPVPI